MMGLTLGTTRETSLDAGTTARGAPPPWYGLAPGRQIFTPGRLFVDYGLVIVVEEHDPHLARVHRDFVSAELPGGADLWLRP